MVEKRQLRATAKDFKARKEHLSSLVVTASTSLNTKGANPPSRALHISEGQTEVVAEKL